MTSPLSSGTLSRQALDELGDLLDVGMVTLDAQMVITGWNRWMQAATGKRAAQVLGTPVLDLFPEMVGTAAERALRTACAGRAVVFSHHFHRYLLPLPPMVGFTGVARMQQSARLVPVMRHDGSVEGAVIIIQDVTDRVAREEALRQTMTRAEAASQAKSDFLAAMSHELRTPLAAVLGYTDVLSHEMAGPLNETQQRHLDRVRACAQHLMSIIEQILTFSRVDAGREEVLAAETDAVDLARDAVAVLQPQASEKGLELETNLPDGPVRLLTDVTKLRQILINLLGNAVKFTDHGRVRLEVESGPATVTFRVVDTGPGIDALDAQRVFEPFTQVDQSPRRTKGGTGLGLPVSRRLAHLLGGDLLLESTPGAGSTFTLELPLEPSPRTAAPLDTHAAPPQAPITA